MANRIVWAPRPGARAPGAGRDPDGPTVSSWPTWTSARPPTRAGSRPRPPSERPSSRSCGPRPLGRAELDQVLAAYR